MPAPLGAGFVFGAGLGVIQPVAKLLHQRLPAFFGLGSALTDIVSATAPSGNMLGPEPVP